MSTGPSSSPRIVVVGSSCAGKTTFAGALSAARGCARIELDELFWDRGWEPKPPAEFRRLVAEAAAGEAWVAAGNYGTARPLLWPRATTVVWLDYGLPFVFARALRRTLRRCVTGERLYHGNVESWRRAFRSRESILWWVLSTFGRRRREFARLQASGEFAHVTWRRVRRPRDAEALLRELARRA
jgi:adenylate kinase family enzyme